MLTMLLLITGVLMLSGATMYGLTALWRSPAGQDRHISDGKGRPISDAQFERFSRPNTILSLVLVYGPAYALYGFLFHAESASVLRIVLEGLGILLVYDFGYYFIHRYPFHEWKVLRKVHAIHHTIKHPNALDSLYQHPVENLLGLSLWWVSAVVVRLIAGPISIYALGWSFLVYSLLNVAIHSGLKFKSFPLSIVSYLGMRHYKHHAGMRAKNYASVTPIFDLLFRTEET